ncbi:unnamed protein product [Allacma fusca]|uniref:Uncharacterized protein n=1 Tax=Allacma fusca TaxID=39272 RepID=A0A8J2KJV4_9HEXA|nr:unnamed protein product [Allacma fusca]
MCLYHTLLSIFLHGTDQTAMTGLTTSPDHRFYFSFASCDLRHVNGQHVCLKNEKKWRYNIEIEVDSIYGVIVKACEKDSALCTLQKNTWEFPGQEEFLRESREMYRDLEVGLYTKY